MVTIENIREFYDNTDRLQTVDPMFLEFEENMLDKQDLQYLCYALLLKSEKGIKLPNPHNSCILYVTELSDEFDHSKARSDTVGGAPPDIDMDFDAFKRDEMIQWIVEKWGRSKVANIATFGKFKPRSLVDRYFKVTEKQARDAQKVKKAIPPDKFGFPSPFEEVIEASPWIETEFPDFCRAAQKLEGMVNQFGVHAGGVVIADTDLWDHIPTWCNSGFDHVTQWDMRDVEEVGFIKFDFLNLNNMSIIDRTIKNIRDRQDIDIELESIPDFDDKTYDMLSQGYLAGVFQMEASSHVKELFQKIKPKSIAEISDLSSLNRPGPMEAGLIDEYIERKNDSSLIPTEHPEIVKTILEPTHYTLIYQEQVMQIVSELAGFTLVEADDVRRAMGKKKIEVLGKYKEQFIHGAIEKGVDEIYANGLWHQLEGFAKYCFNKSHGISYSRTSYLCAYFKANYPLEFFCALLTVRSQTSQPKLWAGKAPEYLQEAREMGIKIHGPSINKSELGFSIKNDEIYFGLAAIRDVGAKAIKTILRARGRKSFDSVHDFLSRINLSKINTKIFEALVRAGVFDSMGYARKDLLDHIEELYSYPKDLIAYEERKVENKEREKFNADVEPKLERRKELLAIRRRKTDRDLSMEEEQFLDETVGLRRKRMLSLTVPNKPEIPREHEINLSLNDIIEQANYIGCFLTVHPAIILYPNSARLSEIDDETDRIDTAGYVVSLKRHKTKNGNLMCFMEVGDGTGIAEVIVFPSIYRYIGSQLDAGKIVRVLGRVDSVEPIVKLIANKIEIWSPDELHMEPTRGASPQNTAPH